MDRAVLINAADQFFGGLTTVTWPYSRLHGRVTGRSSPSAELATPKKPIEAAIRAKMGKRETSSAHTRDESLVLVHGIVLDSDDESPVAGARLDARSVQGLNRTAVGDAAGAFRFSVPRRTTFNLRIEADGYEAEYKPQIYIEANTQLSVRRLPISLDQTYDQ